MNDSRAKMVPPRQGLGARLLNAIRHPVCVEVPDHSKSEPDIDPLLDATRASYPDYPADLVNLTHGSQPTA
jgi:hypothetical protein